MAGAPLSYAAGSGFVQHVSGKRWTREQVQEARDYHQGVVDMRHADPIRRESSAEMIRQIDQAVAQTWPEPKRIVG